MRHHGVFRELRAVLNCCILRSAWRTARHLAGEVGKSEITVGYKESGLYPAGDQATSKCSKGSTVVRIMFLKDYGCSK